ncbi:hypothetical protein [Mucilaginibacter pedocola]|uniref:DUF4105 domain-containing protein n=1 Tax=Mucilaginibacter pedocola TaxID=1792845 RepID=A0A1S9P634_9SPHI|nr:hypothetical protein [Mucilaginibacter pedocola]OOQ56413.1 hypothetical protein BC343_18355 [Mucilaginibacter pedocola]
MEGRIFSSLLKNLIITAVLGAFALNTQAQVISAVNYSKPVITDTATYQKEAPGYVVNNTTTKALALKDASLQQELQLSISKPAERRLLMEHLREINPSDGTEANQTHKKFLYNLAGAFARLKMYSLAMKCFFKSMQYDKKSLPADTLANGYNAQADTLDIDEPDERYLDFNDKDDTLLNDNPALLVSPTAKEPRSPKVSYTQIADAFNDGKKAAAYAMLIHVKQPVSGKNKVYHFTNSGHTFITLIKYNSDSTYVSLSFGFYPNKQHPFAGTPLFPSSHSTFRDDGQHKWDEVAGKFISKRRFQRILALTKNYNGIKYHLSKNNCTDFSLNAALLAGLSIDETTGSWPLGHGNNPGITGQSMLHGKIKDGGKAVLDEVFVDDMVE